jgi:hypothetical protein
VLREQKNWRALRVSIPHAHHHLPECTKDHSSHSPFRQRSTEAEGTQVSLIEVRDLLRG